MIEIVLGLLLSMVSMRIFLYRAFIHFPACAEFPIFTMFHSACFILRQSLTEYHNFIHDTLQNFFTHNFRSNRIHQNENSLRRLRLLKLKFRQKSAFLLFSKLFSGVIEINLVNIADQFISDCICNQY